MTLMLVFAFTTHAADLDLGLAKSKKDEGRPMDLPDFSKVKTSANKGQWKKKDCKPAQLPSPNDTSSAAAAQRRPLTSDALTSQDCADVEYKIGD